MVQIDRGWAGLVDATARVSMRWERVAAVCAPRCRGSLNGTGPAKRPDHTRMMLRRRCFEEASKIAPQCVAKCGPSVRLTAANPTIGPASGTCRPVITLRPAGRLLIEDMPRRGLRAAAQCGTSPAHLLSDSMDAEGHELKRAYFERTQCTASCDRELVNVDCTQQLADSGTWGCDGVTHALQRTDADTLRYIDRAPHVHFSPLTPQSPCLSSLTKILSAAPDPEGRACIRRLSRDLPHASLSYWAFVPGRCSFVRSLTCTIGTLLNSCNNRRWHSSDIGSDCSSRVRLR